jgi:hypothetical protein
MVHGTKTRSTVYPSTDALLTHPARTKPEHIQIGMPPAFDPPTLNVTHFDGSVECVKISRRAAAVLIAYGIGSEG